MRLRVFDHFHSSDSMSVAYLEFECSAWEVTSTLLIIQQPTGIRYLPLMAVKSFMEVSSEN